MFSMVSSASTSINRTSLSNTTLKLSKQDDLEVEEVSMRDDDAGGGDATELVVTAAGST